MSEGLVIFACDLFEEDYPGGAELTTSALILKHEYKIQKINCHMVDSEFISQNKYKKWIIGNFSSLTDKAKYEIVKNNIQYSIIEYDYKFCTYRNPSLHVLKEGICDCEKLDKIKMLNVFFHKAKKVFYMSEKQKSICESKLKNFSNGYVLSSVFKKNTIDYIKSLNKTKNNKWLIYNTQNFLKGTNKSIKYAKENDLDYELFSNLTHRETIDRLSKSKGLIFLPNGEDTCPRLVIEARLCECELICNEKVQHFKEQWFENSETCLNYMETRADKFWEIFNESF